MKKILKIFCILLFSTHSFAQNYDIDCDLTNLYVNQQTEKFGYYIQVLDTAYEKNPSSLLQFKRMKVRHFYIAHLLFYDSKSEEIEPQLEGMKRDIVELEKNPHYTKKVIAFKSAYAAYVAIESPSTAIWYLPKSFSLAKDAIEILPESPYSWAEYGNLEYSYTLFLGGNFKDAIHAYTKAVELFEKQNVLLQCNWYYLNTLLFLAKSYEDNKQLAEANKVYYKILKIRPDYEAIHRWKHKL